MRTHLAFCVLLSALLAAGCSAKAPNELEIWMAGGEACNACDIWADAFRRREYGDVIEYTVQRGDRSGQIVRAAVKWISKDEIPAAILHQLPAADGPKSEHWPITVSVLVVEDGKVLSVGNIAGSADVANARFSDAIMNPPADPQADDPAFRPHDELLEYFKENWNLEYFLEMAYAKPDSAGPPDWLDSAKPIPYADRNVVIWGAAGTPENNDLFISERMKEIDAALDTFNGADGLEPVYLYANGAHDKTLNTLYTEEGRDHFKNITFPNALPSSKTGLARLFKTIEMRPDARTLLVQVGHSGPLGAPQFGFFEMLTREEMESAAEDRDMIMVSGACMSGQFAEVGKCGFFAARPELVSSGCQQSAEAIRHSDDYLRHFFSAVGENSRAGADANGDGTLSFAEAHWYAVVRVEGLNMPYTTLDSLADRYFRENPEALPEGMEPGEVMKLAAVATPGERDALQAMLADVAPDSEIALTGVVELNKKLNHALEKTGADEWTSLQRDEYLDLPYKLTLVTLVKRLLFKRADDPMYESAIRRTTICEAQSIRDYL